MTIPLWLRKIFRFTVFTLLGDEVCEMPPPPPPPPFAGYDLIISPPIYFPPKICFPMESLFRNIVPLPILLGRDTKKGSPEIRLKVKITSLNSNMKDNFMAKNIAKILQ